MVKFMAYMSKGILDGLGAQLYTKWQGPNVKFLSFLVGQSATVAVHC